MHDLIRRQDAIDAISNYTVSSPPYFSAWTDRLVSAIKDDLVDDIENIYPAQQWIPVSERLPESTEGVLVCGREALNNSVIYAVKWYDNGVWRPLSAPSCSWEAWMPLPESFYGNENGK